VVLVTYAALAMDERFSAIPVTKEGLIIYLLQLLGIICLALLYLYWAYTHSEQTVVWMILLLICIMISIIFSVIGAGDLATTGGLPFMDRHLEEFSSGTMVLLALVFTVMTILYNYLMRTSKTMKSVIIPDRLDFAIGNPSWVLLRLAGFLFSVGTVYGVTVTTSQAMPKPPYGERWPIHISIFVISMFMLSMAIGVFGMLKISKLNNLATLWMPKEKNTKRPATKKSKLMHHRYK
jgi:amino acid transporter